MPLKTWRKNLSVFSTVAALVCAALACSRPLVSNQGPFWSISNQELPTAAVITGDSTAEPWAFVPKRTPGGPIYTPTPDQPHKLPPMRTSADQYMVQSGDSLGMIAARYGVNVSQIVSENDLTNPDYLEIGQILVIPAPTPQTPGPDFKIIPDSELVYGPTAIFDVQDFVQKSAGFLSTYKEEVEDQSLSGAEIVTRIARDYSVNPRLLLAVLEHQSHWLSTPHPPKTSLEYPLGVPEPQRKGLYKQLAWAANNLNRGYYYWRAGSLGTWLLADGSIVPIAPTINAGTAAIQQMYALLLERPAWEKMVSADGLFSTYQAMFGYPFDYAYEPLLPYDLFQPQMRLPFEDGIIWYFTSGPHGGWGDGSAWAALDFAPPGGELGCVENNAWVTASADGLIIRAENGAVIQDLDGDGLEQTGWVLLYMHVESRDRVQPGAYLKAGEHLGHPSCEGGVSSGTHLHIARKYNGEWIPAGHTLPFNLDGWVATGLPNEYDGYLNRGGSQIEAYGGVNENGISR